MTQDSHMFATFDYGGKTAFDPHDINRMAENVTL